MTENYGTLEPRQVNDIAREWGSAELRSCTQATPRPIICRHTRFLSSATIPRQAGIKPCVAQSCVCSVPQSMLLNVPAVRGYEHDAMSSRFPIRKCNTARTVCT